jgi:hypothetical protein
MEGLDYALMMEMEASDAAMQDQDLLDQQEIDFLLEAAASMASAVENAMSGSERRRVVSRGLPMESCLAHYLLEGDAATFKFQFRMTKRQLGDKDVYRNYKGWHSILLVAYVNSMHLIVNPFVAGTGRTSDNGALKWCAFLQKLQNPEERVKWLGQDGLVAGDGGTSDNKGILLTPIPGATELEDLWYNFCHSSTRFFVEETFGRLKNRFRMLLTEMHMPYPLAARIIAACCVLHN